VAKRRRPVQEQEAEQGEALTPYQLRFAIVDRIAKVAETLIRYGCIAGIVYWVSHSVELLAGKQTAADIGIKFLANVTISETVAWIFGVGGVGYGMRQRKLRREDTKQMGARLSKYETKIDPQRSSSKLESQGDYRED